MAKARPRYIVTGRVTFNNATITGQKVVELGTCNSHGDTKTADGKKIPAKQLTHRKFRIEDKVWVRENHIKHMSEFVMSPDQAAKMLSPVEED